MLLRRPRRSERTKSRIFPIILRAQKKNRSQLIYGIIGFAVVAGIVAYLFVPYFHKPKQIAQPVVAPGIAPVKPVRIAANAPSKPEEQKPAIPQKESVKEKKIDAPRILAKKQSRDKKRVPSLPPSSKEGWS